MIGRITIVPLFLVALSACTNGVLGIVRDAKYRPADGSRARDAGLVGAGGTDNCFGMRLNMRTRRVRPTELFNFMLEHHFCSKSVPTFAHDALIMFLSKSVLFWAYEPFYGRYRAGWRRCAAVCRRDAMFNRYGAASIIIAFFLPVTGIACNESYTDVPIQLSGTLQSGHTYAGTIQADLYVDVSLNSQKRQFCFNIEPEDYTSALNEMQTSNKETFIDMFARQCADKEDHDKGVGQGVLTTQCISPNKIGFTAVLKVPVHTTDCPPVEKQ